MGICSLRADFTIVEEFEGEKEKVKSVHSLLPFRSRDKSYIPVLIVYGPITFGLIVLANLASNWLELGQQTIWICVLSS